MLIVGQKYKLKDYIASGSHYHNGQMGFAKEMKKYHGDMLTIKKEVTYSGGTYYRVDENGWSWIEEWFEPLNPIISDLLGVL